MTASTVPVMVVDAFTNTLFRGSPASVVLMPRGQPNGQPMLPDDTALQQCAEEFHLSETVFVSSVPDGAPAPPVAPAPGVAFLGIRWFTPTREVGLCGHATLAASHCVFSSAGEGDGTGRSQLLSSHREAVAALLDFQSNVNVAEEAAGAVRQRLNVICWYNRFSGWLCVRRSATIPAQDRYVLDFPLRTPHAVPHLHPASCHIAEALGLVADDVDDLQLHDGSGKFLLVLRSESAVWRAQADTRKLVELFAADPLLSSCGVKPLSVTITAKSSGGQSCRPNGHSTALSYDVVSRHFAPWVGIDEDPVTGAAHVVLVPYWLRRLSSNNCNGGDDKENSVPVGGALRCYQASHRGGFMECTVQRHERIELEGSAVTFLVGSAVLQCAAEAS